MHPEQRREFPSKNQKFIFVNLFSNQSKTRETETSQPKYEREILESRVVVHYLVFVVRPSPLSIVQSSLSSVAPRHPQGIVHLFLFFIFLQVIASEISKFRRRPPSDLHLRLLFGLHLCSSFSLHFHLSSLATDKPLFFFFFFFTFIRHPSPHVRN